MEIKTPDANPTQTSVMNPGAESKQVTRRNRIPMSIPYQKLQVPEVPGFRLYWFKEENIERALAAGYEFVKKHEVKLNRNNVAGSPGVSGNTDLGTNVSLIAGGISELTNAPARLTLMKIPMEFYLEDQKLIAERNAKVLEAIFVDEQVPDRHGNLKDKDPLTYVDKTRTTALFNRPIRKKKIVR